MTTRWGKGWVAGAFALAVLALGAGRVDFLGIRLGEEAIDFHWVQN